MSFTLVAVFLLCLLVQSTVSHSTQNASSCFLKPATLDRFAYLTFYSWHFATGAWTNVGQSSGLSEIQAFYNATGRTSLLEVASIFFQPMSDVNTSLRGLTIRPDWRNRWGVLASTLASYVERKIITGFFLGDELVWNNITWDQLSETSEAIKETFPAAFVFYNEGGAPLYASRNVNHFHVEYPHVPQSIDFVSTDDYDSMLLAKNPRWFYESFLYSKIIFPHQRVFVIPPVYAWLNNTCGVACWDDQQLAQAVQYFQWIDADDMIAGSSGFHFSSYPPSDLGLVSLPKTLLCYMNVSKQLVAHKIS